LVSFRIADLFIEFAANPVLGGEEGDEFNALGFYEEVDRGRAVASGRCGW